MSDVPLDELGSGWTVRAKAKSRLDAKRVAQMTVHPPIISTVYEE